MVRLVPDWVYFSKRRPAISLIYSVANELGLSGKVVDFSTRLYLILLGKRLTVGRKREALVGACIYISCMGVNYPIKLVDLCRVLDVSKKELVRQKRFIKRHVDSNEQGFSVNAYINRYGFELGLSVAEVSQALRVFKIINESLINHKTSIIAAVCVYLACRHKVSLRGLARLTGLSRSGIFEAYKRVKHLIPATDLLTFNQSVHFISKS